MSEECLEQKQKISIENFLLSKFVSYFLFYMYIDQKINIVNEQQTCHGYETEQKIRV